MSLSPRAAQAKVLRQERRAADRRVLHLVPRIGLVFTGDFAGLGGAFRIEGWEKEGSKWFFCGRENKENQRQIRLLLAWAKQNGERISVRRTDAGRFYSESQLLVQGISPSIQPPPRRQLQLQPDWDYIERRARGQLAAKKAKQAAAAASGAEKVAEELGGGGGGGERSDSEAGGGSGSSETSSSSSKAEELAGSTATASSSATEERKGGAADV